ncbi:hypothetical protein ALC60_03946 [Trachymyrmex zeteki]|uniref:Uncharacterized protein n=1 Tax=Mycetomoellerius zeteki TaxID=64791 RepID=A0A151X9Z9_9HYME|nr:hypothetical protein ALC60_03946 [Trachymyrmex zeteki]
MPGYMVVPPDRTVLAYRSLRMSTSHFMIELYVVSMRNTIARIQHDTGGTTGRVERQDSLDRHVHGGSVERLEHNLRHLFAISLGIQRCLGKKNRMFFRSYSQFVIERVMPDLLHVVPVGNDTVFDRILECQDTPLGLGLVTDVRVLLSHTNHDTLVPWPADDRRKDGAGSIIPGEASLAHTGSIVDYERCYFLVAHVSLLALSTKGYKRITIGSQRQNIIYITKFNLKSKYAFSTLFVFERKVGVEISFDTAAPIQHRTQSVAQDRSSRCIIPYTEYDSTQQMRLVPTRRLTLGEDKGGTPSTNPGFLYHIWKYSDTEGFPQPPSHSLHVATSPSPRARPDRIATHRNASHRIATQRNECAT